MLLYSSVALLMLFAQVYNVQGNVYDSSDLGTRDIGYGGIGTGGNGNGATGSGGIGNGGTFSKREELNDQAERDFLDAHWH